MRKAFTLMEVNLAIMIMAGGILSVLGLYSLGYRENRQSREDVAAAAYADSVISPLVMALSDPKVKWSKFKDLPDYPNSSGWGYFLNARTGQVEKNPDSEAKKAFKSAIDKVGSEVSSSWPTSPDRDLKAGLVILHDQNSPVVRIAFRATRNVSELLSMPLFYTEVMFQGVPE